MSKRLIVLCDGTWNKAENLDRRKRKPTNVMKMVRAIQPVTLDGTVQVTYYDEGVGNNPGLDRWLGGGVGAGLDRNIREAYRFLLYNYTAGDAVFFFGFSRGAYTVRSLAGFIQHLGLLPKTRDFFVPEAYALYRQRPPAEEDQTAWQQQVAAFRATHQVQTIAVDFVGVWDTVGALGLPLSWFTLFNRRRYQFHDARLSPIIRHAYHALAIDEQRRPFQPSLWENPGPEQVLEQRWFAGVHTNVGGGYEHDGLANCTLHWMKNKAVAQGLGVDEEFLRFYKPWFGDELRNSMTWFYRLLGRYLRPIGAGQHSYEVVDESVERRRRHTPVAYRPANVPPGT
ncbi:DUF2235 domain-containing protein [Hymenobacter ginsengisoli]|uniref:DUF2235 domain-containing protein n=1 Tax=Hymenobacter ginsengisoli TaxID=1051626 RepID=A0ABP8QSK6_9BACT|nr:MULTISPECIES: DUF2235 domain-containing protein [unclassified Hymenobacter]MBO2033402.1 DUF2235 domain-containing protein [Hymenobacter sp. BT559]